MRVTDEPLPPSSRPERSADGSSPPTWGIYTLANDAVLKGFLALTGSLLEFAPEMPLRVIPFDSRQERIAPILERIGARYFESPALRALDAIGDRFYPDSPGQARCFRKFAAFHGPFERFIFLDSDVVSLAPIELLCRAIDASDVDLVHFDTDMDQVYRTGPLLSSIRSTTTPHGFNTGLWASRRDVVTLDQLESVFADLDDSWRDQLVPTGEQPFINLAIDRLGRRAAGADELLPEFCSTCWPAVGTIVTSPTGFRLDSPERWDHGRRLFFAHWAGFLLDDSMPNRSLFERYEAAGRVRCLGS